MQSFSESAFQDSGLFDRREVLPGSASDSIGQLAARGVRFDIAFLDADKTGYLVRVLRVLGPEHAALNPIGLRTVITSTTRRHRSQVVLCYDMQGYYQQLMDKQLIVPGGMIVVDNALMKVLPHWRALSPIGQLLLGTSILSVQSSAAACKPQHSGGTAVRCARAGCMRRATRRTSPRRPSGNLTTLWRRMIGSRS